jgi:hypothetical protein
LRKWHKLFKFGRMIWAGLGFLMFGGFGLLAGLATDSIPMNWPFRPIPRDEQPRAFRAYIFITSASSALGLVLLMASR